ncbi:acetyltransferase [Moumouvirus australiensis]|uniref:Acetyltransferase domain protein n=1 Tax=Moumouvirus australiensis TaxID=2109587 RepID=A0A2P1ELV4_9VIRU|nr:acetyltransferase [Moumouvirus australiensis]AVL94852.1 acetyltransferase [Moumouvirus australiensis]
MDIYIIGCGGNSKIVIDICLLNGYNIIGIFDDKFNSKQDNFYKNYKIIGKINDIQNFPRINIVNSIGDNKIRLKIYNELIHVELNWINCIHPNSYISPTVKIGKGNIICYGAVINSDAKIGNFNIVNTYALIEHDNIIGDFNHLAPRTTLCGGINIGNCNLLGASTSVIPGIKIGNNNIIGCMSAIIKNIKNNNLVVGVPGKIIRDLDE